jgi:hypothetical protein
VRRVLFDENLPRRLRRDLPEFAIRTVQEEGWGSFKNGQLLRRAEGSFDVLITADRRMEFQQDLTAYDLGIVVLQTRRLRFQTIRTAIEQIRAAVATVRPREIIRITIS